MVVAFVLEQPIGWRRDGWWAHEFFLSEPTLQGSFGLYIGAYRFCIGPYAREYDAKMGATRTAGLSHQQGGATDAPARGRQIPAAGARRRQLPRSQHVEDATKPDPEGAGVVRPDRAAE